MEKPVGELLSQWKIYLTNISRNLMELSDQTEVKIVMLKAKDSTNGYTGITKLKAEKCVECMEKLWQYYAVLAEVIDKANALNNKSGFLYNPEDDIRKILEGASIVFESQRIDINNRKLLSGENDEKLVTPQVLLKYMEDSFESLCKDTLEISQATNTVKNRLDGMKTDISKLNNIVRKLGISDFPEFDVSRITKFERDPLQGLIELDKLVYSIEKYRTSIKNIEEEYSNILKAISSVKESLYELKNLAEKSQRAIAESQKMFLVVRNMRPTISNEVLTSLEEWLRVLETKLKEGQLKAVRVGVLRLQQECLSKLDIERENYSINCKDYNELQDLKGEFKALIAKSEALKIKGLIYNSHLDEIIENTRNTLYEVRVDLDNCRKLVKDFKLSLDI